MFRSSVDSPVKFNMTFTIALPRMFMFCIVLQHWMKFSREKRVNQNPDYYRLRQQITEHQFGTLKRQWGFTFTLMKGKENVLSEVNIMMMCYNLTRLMSILGPNDLKHWLNSLYCIIKRIYEAVKLDLSLLLYLKKEINSKAFNILRPLNISI